MRLINTTSLKFGEFYDSDLPPYAILSHRWTGNEVSFQDYEGARNYFLNIKLGTEELQGEVTCDFSKINSCCSLAQQRGLRWVWIDTCCIDKKSSAELSEAINSMYRWYAGAHECYAYLLDLSMDEEDNEDELRAMFRRSAWFTRGWTLQELLAPLSMIFYNQQWKTIGTRKALSADISTATGILPKYILNSDELKFASIATKMSWASRRTTSRVEDVAYCLLGLFGVNMPLLYGEGHKAFLRLQMEIIKISNDDSLFAWTSGMPYSGLLADGPKCFADSGDIRCFHPLVSDYARPYSMTNIGLEIYTAENRTRDYPVSLHLNCCRKVANSFHYISIILS